MRTWFHTHRKITAAACALLFVGLVVPITSGIAHLSPPPDAAHRLVDWAIRGLLAVLLYFFILFVWAFIERVSSGDRVYRLWLWVTVAYLAVNGVLLALIWPGYWVWDEYVLLHAVQTFGLPAWQGIFTTIFYALCLNVIPTGVGIVIIQNVFAAIVVGYVVAQTSTFLRHKRLALLLIVPFLFVPVLLNNMYPLRLTVYSYIEVLFIFRLLLIAKRPSVVTSRYREVIVLSTLVTLLAFWRTEGIYYLILIPILMVVLGFFRVPGQRVVSTVAALACGLIVVTGFGLVNSTADPRYQLTASINPLSVMLQQPLQGEHLQENLAVLNTVINLDMVKAMPDAYGIPSFWADNGAVIRDGFREHLTEYNIAFASIVLDNPGPFLAARFETFWSTNSLSGPAPHVHGGGTFVGVTSPEVAAAIAAFEKQNVAASPLNSDLRRSVIQSFLMLDDTQAVLPLGKAVWTIIPVTVLLVAGLGLAFFRRKILFGAVIVLVLLRVAGVFVSAPANFFMYYLPVFMSGWFLLFHFGIRWLDDSRSFQKATSWVTGRRKSTVAPFVEPG